MQLLLANKMYFGLFTLVVAVFSISVTSLYLYMQCCFAIFEKQCDMLHVANELIYPVTLLAYLILADDSVCV